MLRLATAHGLHLQRLVVFMGSDEPAEMAVESLAEVTVQVAERDYSLGILQFVKLGSGVSE